MPHPALWLAGLGALAFFLRGTARQALLLAAPLMALAMLWALPEGTHGDWSLLGQRLQGVRIDALSRLFGSVFAVAAFAGVLFALRQPSRAEVPAALVYAGAAIGAVLAADLVTLFLFWEAMAVASTLVLWAAGPAAFPAAQRYLAVHLLGGMLFMAGAVGHVSATGSVAIEAMAPDTVAKGLMLAGFLVNAAAVPLASWLPDAYPEASWSGMVFLSAFTTKVAVVVVLRVFPGADVLVPIGLVMALYGIVYAAVASDMRRILAYAIVNQQGLMLVGIGLGSPLALNGAASHAVASVFYTGLLAMATGAVLRETGRRDCGDLGGLWRSMPFTAACAGIGALGFAGAPLVSGFVTKSMTGMAAAEAGLDAVRWAITAASALSLLHAGLKLPWRVFLHRDCGLRPAEAPVSQRLAMGLLAALTLAVGLAPGALYALLPFPVSYEPYTLAGVAGTLATLGAGVLIFWLLRPLLRRSNAGLRDIDGLWRGPGLQAWQGLLAALANVGERFEVLGGWALRRLRAAVSQGSAGASLARGWTVRTMVLWVVIALAGMLLLSYR